jgi:hypothetical protein
MGSSSRDQLLDDADASVRSAMQRQRSQTEGQLAIGDQRAGKTEGQSPTSDQRTSDFSDKALVLRTAQHGDAQPPIGAKPAIGDECSGEVATAEELEKKAFDALTRRNANNKKGTRKRNADDASSKDSSAAPTKKKPVGAATKKTAGVATEKGAATKKNSWRCEGQERQGHKAGGRCNVCLASSFTHRSREAACLHKGRQETHQRQFHLYHLTQIDESW